MFSLNLSTLSRATTAPTRFALKRTYALAASRAQHRIRLSVITLGSTALRGLRTDWSRGHSSLTKSRFQPYATTTDGSQPANEKEGGERPPWIEVLESVADGPWLENTIPDEKLRLSIAHGLIYQMLLYLSRPIGDVHFDAESPSEAHAQYLSAFETARVPDHSEMGRARIASAKLIKSVVHQTNSIPATSSLRKDNENVFKIVEALTAITDAHLTNNDGVVEDWKQFWSHAQPVLVGLAQELSEKGFVLQEPEEEGASH